MFNLIYLSGVTQQSSIMIAAANIVIEPLSTQLCLLQCLNLYVMHLVQQPHLIINFQIH